MDGGVEVGVQRGDRPRDLAPDLHGDDRRQRPRGGHLGDDAPALDPRRLEPGRIRTGMAHREEPRGRARAGQDHEAAPQEAAPAACAAGSFGLEAHRITRPSDADGALPASPDAEKTLRKTAC